MEAYKEGTRTPLQTDRHILFGGFRVCLGKGIPIHKGDRRHHQHLPRQPVNAPNDEHSHCSLLGGGRSRL